MSRRFLKLHLRGSRTGMTRGQVIRALGFPMECLLLVCTSDFSVKGFLFRKG